MLAQFVSRSIVFLFATICLLLTPVKANAASREELESGFQTFEAQLESIVMQREQIELHAALIRTRHKTRIGAVLVSTGRTESRISWHEYALKLVSSGFDVAIIEHRGQGLSTRTVPGSQINHIVKFEDYVEDFDFMVEALQSRLKGPYFFLASSMGAPISLLSTRARGGASAYVLNAPMFQVRPRFIPTLFAKVLAWVLMKLGRAEKYAPFTGPFDPQFRFEDNLYARDRNRFEFVISKLRERPQFQVGGPSVQWISEALKTPQRLEDLSHRMNQTKQHPPILILQAEKEYFVDNDIQSEWCSQTPNCQVKYYPDARHVLHMELDPVLDDALSTSLEFFKKHSVKD